jgi:hypothetical protein
MKAKEIVKLHNVVNEFSNKVGINFSIDCLNDIHNTIIIQPKTKSDFLAGMQILYDVNGFEVSEYMAGVKENELWIYKNTNSIKIALKELMKGNNRTPIKVWN